MSRLTDAVLTAYINKSLDPVEQKIVDDTARRDPELWDRINRLRGARQDLHQASGQSKSERPVEHKVLFTRSNRAECTATSQVTVQRDPESSWLQKILTPIRHLTRWNLIQGIAAGVAVAVGFGTHALLMGGNDSLSSHNGFVIYRDGDLWASSELDKALETLPDGQRAMLARGSGFVLPTLTFEDHRKRFCREYDMSIAAPRQFGGVACRARDGGWRVLVHVRTVSSGGSEDTFTPASGADAQFVEWASEQMKSGDAFDSKTLENLIAGGWNKLPVAE